VISRQEILDFSREFGIRANIVEKDYVLYWILAGIANHPELGSNWIFKGGTCLKKCYFETYRFSEDLDFTLSKKEHINQNFLQLVFSMIADWIIDVSGVEIPKNFIRFDIFENPRGIMSAQGRISYRGPLQPHDPLPRIKLDLSTDEILVLPSAKQTVHHPYTDKQAEDVFIDCYCYEELFAEKIRALTERLRPRDLYDVIHMYRHTEDMKPNRHNVHQILQNKCEFKEIPLPTIDILKRKPELEELESEWENMLAHQLPILPAFDQFWQELPAVFDWLYRALEKAIPAHAPIGDIPLDETWRLPPIAQIWNMPAPLEMIRFAAANRLCVNLKYSNTYRLIEPYSLRKTRDGNLLLFAVKHNTGDLRSYRVDRIQNVEITKQMYTPRYAVELTTSGPISTPSVQRKSGPSTKSKYKTKRTSRRSRSYFGSKYIIECPVCGKRFTRKTNNPKLNPHKDKKGYPCAGRSGFLADVK
jgi:predicted nucleotidyltransferase component of viral defense system